jgi:Arc/MetJ-type ribon-helix-helix transcriptional regulator
MHTMHTIEVTNTLVKGNSRCQTCAVTGTKTRKELRYPLSFRVPLSQVEEIDRAVAKEKRKRRSDLLEAIWEAAWLDYRKSGSLGDYTEGKRSRKYSKRVSEELQDQLYTGLETILERAPSAVIEEIARKITQWAGKYGDEKGD